MKRDEAQSPRTRRPILTRRLVPGGLFPVLLLVLGMQVLPSDSARTAAARLLPVEQTIDDAVIQQRLQGVFARVDEFDSVRVEVASGVVRLTGTVVQPQAAQNAERLARQFEGVAYVDNDIEAETDISTRVVPAVERIRAYVRRGINYLPLLGVALIVVALSALIAMVLGKWEAPRRVLGINPLVWALIRRVLRALVVLIGLILAFDVLGITTLVGAGLGAAGIAGLALGFAFKDIVENYLAGMLMSIRRPFDVNDLVEIDQYEGRIVRLTSRDLLLLTLEGNHVRLPNSLVFKSPIINYTRNPRRLLSFDIGIDLGEDLTHAMEVGTSTIAALNGILPDPPPFAYVQQLGGSDVVVRFFGWVDQEHSNYFKVKSEAIRLVKEAMDEAGVELPEPIYRVRLRQDDHPAPAEDKATGRIASVHDQARNADTAPDHKMERQVQDEVEGSEEENLLLTSGKAGSRKKG